MFERFTKRARRAVEQAVEIAAGLRATQVRPEHLFAALLATPTAWPSGCSRTWAHRPTGFARSSSTAAVATSTGSATRTRRRSPRSASTWTRCCAAWADGSGEGRRRGRPRFSRESKKALELSLREAIALRHNYIGTEHILLGLVRGGDPVVRDTLAACDVTPASCGGRGRRRTQGQLSRAWGRGQTRAGSRSRSAPRRGRAGPGRGPGSRGRRRGCASRRGRCRPGRGAASRSSGRRPSSTRRCAGPSATPPCRAAAGFTAAQMSTNGWPTISTCLPTGDFATDCGDPALLRARHQVVHEYADPALRPGPEVAQLLAEVVDALEVLHDHALDPQVVAPHLLDELGVVASLDEDPAGPRDPRLDALDGDRPGRRTRRCRRALAGRGDQDDRDAPRAGSPGRAGRCAACGAGPRG